MPVPKSRHYLILSAIIFAVLIAAILIVSTVQNSSGFSRQKDTLGTKVAVIDSVKLKKNSTCFRAHEKTEKMLNDVLSEARKSEQQVKLECDKIRNNPTLSQKQKTKSIAKIEANLTSLSAKYHAEIQNVKNLDMKISAYLEKKIYLIIESIAKSQKIGLVLNTQIKSNISVFYNAKNIDITDFVIQKLNESVPDVSLEELK